MDPKISIIIPCYNSEATLEETLISVRDQVFQGWEAIIINDGSPDNIEAIALEWVEKDSRFKYFKKENGGLGSARNYGIEKAVGIYILPLDSDNKVKPAYTEKAIPILEQQPEVGVVYGNAQYFGEKEGFWKVGPFNKYKMLNHNYIDACAIIRKEVFDELGLYDTNMPYQGHEDWEFWLRVIKSKFLFYYIKEMAFDYRVTENSMIRSFSKEMVLKNENYIVKKHSDLYQKYYSELFKMYIELEKELSVLKSLGLVQKLRKYFNI